MLQRTSMLVVALAIVVAACGDPAADPSHIAELESTTPQQMSELLAASDKPVLLNVWASWCGPCRSEAPLLRAAHAEFGESITFIGVDVRDTQSGARAFLAEFDLDGFTHFFDPGGDVPNALGGFGVPLTFFFAPGGTLVELHSGVIDERTLALLIDEIEGG